MFLFKDFVVAEDLFIRNDLLNLAEAMDEINSMFGLSPRVIEDFQYTLQNMNSLFKSKSSPSEYFDIFSTGAFKEVYKLDSEDKFVIKFCGIDNETEKELEIIQKAKDFGVGEFFIPTFSIPITCGLLQATEVDGGYYKTYDSYAHTYVRSEEYGLNHILIQPKIDRTAYETGHNYFSATTYNRNPIEGVSLSRVRDIPVDSLGWITAVYNCGKEKAELLWKFFEDENLHDLHNNNIGYLTEDKSKPVIIDWLSS